MRLVWTYRTNGVTWRTNLSISVFYCWYVGFSECSFDETQYQWALAHSACSKYNHPVVITLFWHSFDCLLSALWPNYFSSALSYFMYKSICMYTHMYYKHADDNNKRHGFSLIQGFSDNIFTIFTQNTYITRVKLWFLNQKNSLVDTDDYNSNTSSIGAVNCLNDQFSYRWRHSDTMVVMFVRASQWFSCVDVAVDDVDDDGTIFRVVNNIVVKCIFLV